MLNHGGFTVLLDICYPVELEYRMCLPQNLYDYVFVRDGNFYKAH